MGEEPPGISIKDVLLAGIYLHLFQEFSDIFFRRQVAFHEDYSKNFHQQPRLRVVPAWANPAIAGEAQNAEKVVGVRVAMH